MENSVHNCENCKILSSRYVRIALRCVDVFLFRILWTPCPEARCRSPPPPFQFDPFRQHRNGVPVLAMARNRLLFPVSHAKTCGHILLHDTPFHIICFPRSRKLHFFNHILQNKLRDIAFSFPVSGKQLPIRRFQIHNMHPGSISGE